MIKHVLVLPLLLLLLLPIGTIADNNTDAPLTLLNKPQKSTQTTKIPPISNNDNALHDIHGPVTIIEQPPYLLIAGIILLVLFAAIIIFWFLNKRGKQAPLPVPPWEKALRDLADAKKLLNPGQALLYIDRVSQILRSYIESRFAIQSTRQTTREFFQGLTQIGSNSPLQMHKTELRSCLEQADMAKFAHHVPEIKNLQMMEDAVTTFIKRTEPAEPTQSSLQPKQAKRDRP